MAELEAGSTFGRYRIERVIGRGGFGTVYLADDTNPHLPRRVALKILKVELAADASFRERFLRESLMAIDLDQHPSIVAVHDAGEEGGTLFIAMRYIDGTNLSAVLANGPMSADNAGSLIAQIGGALDVAHAAGLVHRDVKPANILLSHHLDHAYLVDFGLTKRIGSDSGLTRAGEFLGTLYYASPEQIEGQAVDGRTDQYSLGCVLYECLTGQPPFTGELNAIITAHLTKPVPSVTATNPSVPPAVDEVIARATAKKPSDRYPTCGELAAAATRALGRAGQTLHESAGALPITQPEATPAHDTVVSSGGAAAAAASVPAAATSAPGQITPPPAPPPAGSAPGTITPPPGPPAGSAPPGGGGGTPPAGFTPATPAKRPRWPLFVGLGVGAIVIVVVLILVLSGGGGSPAPPVHHGPTAAETSLINNHVPPATASTCQGKTSAEKTDLLKEFPSEQSQINNIAAAVWCFPTTQGSPDEVDYVQMGSLNDLLGLYQANLTSNNLSGGPGPSKDGNGTTAGPTSTTCPLEEAYGPTTNGTFNASGRVLCEPSTSAHGGDLVWTQESLQIYSEAFAKTDPTGSLLFTFFQSVNSGPEG
jgi:hypothetical protein